MKKSVAILATIGAISLVTYAHAATFTVTDTGEGWINQAGDANSSNQTNNYIAGNCGAGDCKIGEYRDFFTFSIPTFTGSVTSADFIVNAHQIDTLQQSSISYTLTSTMSDTFADFGTGTVFSSGTYSSTDSGTELDFVLDPAGLAAITSGEMLTLSGRVTSPTVFDATAPNQFIFGGNFSTTSLTFDTGATAAVPEPATWVMMLLGMGLVAYSMRNRGKLTMRISYT